MKSSIPKAAIITAVVAVGALSAAVLVHPISSALSQQSPMMGHAMLGDDQMPGMMQMHGQPMMQMHGQPMMQMHGQGAGHMDMATPALPGQDAFGAIQEIVRMQLSGRHLRR